MINLKVNVLKVVCHVQPATNFNKSFSQSHLNKERKSTKKMVTAQVYFCAL